MKRLCAVSMRVTNASTYHEPRDAIAHDMVRWIEQQGLVPIAVPNSLSSVRLFFESLDVQGVILSGGNSVTASKVDDPDVTPERTKTEYELIDLARQKRVPVLGLCRGMHVVNLYFGGEVLPTISNGRPKHVASEHDVSLSGELAGVAAASSITTNSFHNQGFRAEQLGRDLKAWAVSTDDGVVEGLAHVSEPVLGVQWHPERPNPARNFDSEVLGRFIREGTFWRS